MSFGKLRSEAEGSWRKPVAEAGLRESELQGEQPVWSVQQNNLAQEVRSGPAELVRPPSDDRASPTADDTADENRIASHLSQQIIQLYHVGF